MQMRLAPDELTMVRRMHENQRRLSSPPATDTRPAVNLATSGWLCIALGGLLCVLDSLAWPPPLLMGVALFASGIQWWVVANRFGDEADPLWARVSVSLNFVTAMALLGTVLSAGVATLLMALYLLLNGIAIVIYASSRRSRQKRWEWLVLVGVMNSISGGIVLQSADLALGVLAANLMAQGLAIIGLHSRRGMLKIRR